MSMSLQPLCPPDWACHGRIVALVLRTHLSPRRPPYQEEGLWKWSSGGGMIRGTGARSALWDRSSSSLTHSPSSVRMTLDWPTGYTGPGV